MVKKKIQSVSPLHNLMIASVIQHIGERLCIDLANKIAECDDFKDAKCIIDQYYYEMELKKYDKN